MDGADKHFDAEAFKRFATRVLRKPTPLGASELRLQLAEFQSRIAGDEVMRKPELASGYGRVDALTQILVGGRRCHYEAFQIRPLLFHVGNHFRRVR